MTTNLHKPKRKRARKPGASGRKSPARAGDIVINGSVPIPAWVTVTTRKHDGWIKSKVFGRSFRLTCRKDAKGMSHFNLETK